MCRSAPMNLNDALYNDNDYAYEQLETIGTEGLTAIKK